MKFKIYGVMGSVSGGQSNLGSNTTCLMVKNNKTEIVFDAGSGLINYMNQSRLNKFTLFISHYHLDHILGLPFIAQIYDKDNSFDIYSPDLNGYNVQNALETLMVEPILPMKPNYMGAKLNHHELRNNCTIHIDGLTIKGMLVDHPGGCMIYSIEEENKKISILTDLPDGMEEDKDIMSFCKNSDLLYMDAFFLKEELTTATLRSYGHASVESAINILTKSNSKKLVLGHHQSIRIYSALSKYETDCIFVGREMQEYEI
ncbi:MULTISPECIES: MBL fold metallo-hydrolase [unclassified Fusibacter]|uniref:MBL fold metallo-hydrolase n=1 Tax=unclassified Fusibacter TaxID=2624464 RepID=UPI0010137A4F|nr:MULTISPECIES: MBL fold metallo-hydrolase [unclassified Fusibacter]MCK8058511.1 MBL fold metallo-hydrolase [Fusibacter sp. A2]NPE22720.1 MBL fold metallo-hydrolase [Fusibacter sp. A1]RXV60280.1 MBL fold metallo-hydrolase [Fusibacter sp. A1]